MGKKLFVGGLPWSVTDEELKNFFAPHGSVVEAKVISDRETGRSRGFGFVTYSTDVEAQNAAKALDGAVMGARTINVNEAQEQQRSGGGGGRGYQGGGGGGGHQGQGGGGGRGRYDDRGGGGGGRHDDRGDNNRGRRGDRRGGDEW